MLEKAVLLPNALESETSHSDNTVPGSVPHSDGLGVQSIRDKGTASIEPK